MEHPNMQAGQKNEMYYLWWQSKDTGRRLPAGIAFFEEKFNEYRLKIDYLQAILGGEKECPFYLRTIGQIDGRTLYRAEAVVKRDGKFHSRRVVGEGYLSAETDGEVYVDFGPMEKTLVLSLDCHNPGKKKS
jgi:hypothetical protein